MSLEPSTIVTSLRHALLSARLSAVVRDPDPYRSHEAFCRTQARFCEPARQEFWLTMARKWQRLARFHDEQYGGERRGDDHGSVDSRPGETAEEELRQMR
jgi:hypothetical protein